MYLVMELCEGGELADALKTRERMSEEECKIIMSRLASAISYLHKNGAYCRNSRVIRLFDKGISFTCEWRHCLLINVTLSNTEWIYMHYVLYLNMTRIVSELSILGWIHDLILWNHLNSWRPIFVLIVGILCIRGDIISWMRRLSVSVRKISVSKFVFVKDVNARGSASHEYHKN